MARNKPKRKRPTPTSERSKTIKKQPMNWKRMAIIALMVLAVIGWIISQLPKSNPTTAVPEPPFTYEGTLTFINGNTGAPIKTIDMEVADNNQERMQGLMYRKSMGDDQGMLFVMERNEQQGFWMKNTYIPLDIIYVGADSSIVDIYKDTKPLNTTSMPSQGAAKYVIEVNAGWTTKYGVGKGDKITWERE